MQVDEHHCHNNGRPQEEGASCGHPGHGGVNEGGGRQHGQGSRDPGNQNSTPINI